ncbi:A disintegrin and metalloproteinase with thrombospondin motifs 16 [Lucilia cuprina]|uniref:A disintegrin and metalloproteinase with thrombospondin motifs 16 n=1 Tax=Lucilia cuprina TaxID=7375 RepID=UPI001F053E7D|nr:A disintegrin and metalloproteinase with thrombospondin motifs 16 [Lucilia cuprina]
MVIKPLPHDLSPNQKETSHHVIFKREVDTSEHLSDFAFMEPDDVATSEKLEKLQNRHKRSAHRTTLEDIELEEEQLEADDGLEENEFADHKRAKRQAPYIIYPEILVIVDYDGYRLHGGDNLQVKRYFISFWNGVDLRYRLLKGPRIRISIAGIIISRGRDATPYLERNRVGRDAIDSAAALTDMGKYLFRERRLPVYDIAVAITKYDMCRRRKGGRCTKGTAGFAYVGGACVVNKRLEKVNSVAIIEDTGGFSGIIVAAHEVGHLLGAVHDGSPPPSYLGGPGAQRCRWEDGYIMSDLRHTERGFRWSPCTVQSFHHFLNGDTATCLHNAPHEDSALGRSLPGTLLSLDAQCRRDRGTYACFKDERVCAQLFCFDAQTGYCVAYRPAAEGSSCGNGLHCLDGRCTPLPSNVIPNYGHQYRLGYNNSLQNAAATNPEQQHDEHEEEHDDNDEDGETANDDGANNEGNGGDEDNDESNETIEKLKRKLSSNNLTTKTLQLQQQQLPTTVMPLTTTYLATATPRYGSKSSTGRTSLATPLFYDNYSKKTQQNHNSNNQRPSNGAENKSKLKDGKTPKVPEAKAEDEEATFEAQFLKRTPVNTRSTNEEEDVNDAFTSSSSSLNNNNNNPYFNTKTTKTTGKRSNSNNSRYNHNNNQNNESTRLPQQQQQTPLFVTNFIGDNTQQRLTTIRQQQQQHQQQQPQQQATSTTTSLQHYNNHQISSTPTPQQQQTSSPYHQLQQQSYDSIYLLSSTTRRPKIKTQKLIRRLRTQIK